MNPLIQFKTTPPLLITLALICFGLSPTAKALLPPPAPDGGYPGANTAEGTDALFSLTSGIANTAVGLNALHDNTTGGFNVAVGSSALANNTTGNFNMAIGTDALRDNNANFNLAIGFRVGFMNTTGNHLTGIGAAALRNNTTASFNTAIGADALRENTTGENNTVIGADALSSNTTGSNNTAVGWQALHNDTTGGQNTAYGTSALFAIDGPSSLNNTAIGLDAAPTLTSGQANTVLGAFAGNGFTHGNFNIIIGGGGLTTGDFNIILGANAPGAESHTIRIGSTNHDICYIAGIEGTPVTGTAVVINGSGQLGVAPSSQRFKNEIKRMDKASEALLALKPVTFRYKKELDHDGVPQFGLVAEEVEKVNPDLVVHDKEGKPYSVRYDQVNAMLLNEFLKEHRKVEQLEANATRQQQQIEALTEGLQKVSAQLEISKSAPQTVLNNP